MFNFTDNPYILYCYYFIIATLGGRHAGPILGENFYDMGLEHYTFALYYKDK